jgi:hypothetical protein
MKTRSLLLLVPVVALAITCLALRPGEPGGHTETAAVDRTSTHALNVTPALTAPGTATDTTTDTASDTVSVADAAVDRACQIETHYLPHGDGTVIGAETCVSTSPAEPHAYESYSNAALASLAYADAKAAEVLGMRLRDTDEVQAISLVLRSAALADGDVTPILLFSRAYGRPDSVDGVPARKTIQTKFVLAAVADLLGTDTHYIAPWENEIRRYSSDPETEIAMLQAQAVRIVADLRQIQLDITGSTNIGGQGDA